VNDAREVLHRRALVSYIIDAKLSIRNTSAISTLDIRLILAIAIAKGKGGLGRGVKERRGTVSFLFSCFEILFLMDDIEKQSKFKAQFTHHRAGRLPIFFCKLTPF
jgi:hypothetical protein